MTHLVIILNIDEVDPTLVDPHEVADEILDRELPDFDAERPFNNGAGVKGTYVSAEWAT